MQLHGGKNPIVLYQEMKLQFELHVSIEQLPCNVTGPFADPFVDHFTIFVLKTPFLTFICHLLSLIGRLLGRFHLIIPGNQKTEFRNTGLNVVTRGIPHGGRRINMLDIWGA